MSAAPARNFTRLAASIVIAAIIILGGVLGSSYFGTSRTITETSASTVVQTSTLIQTTTTTVTVTTGVTTTITGASCGNLTSALCLQEMSNIVAQTPQFVTAENGLHYALDKNSSGIGSTSGPGFNKTALGLVYWAYGNQTVTVCGGAGSSPNVLGELTVIVPLIDGLYVTSNMTIIPNDYIQSCPTA
jgi:hypothetical protein